MKPLPRQQYTKEFREHAVQLVLEQKLTIPEVARGLTMSGKTLKNWVGRARLWNCSPAAFAQQWARQQPAAA